MIKKLIILSFIICIPFSKSLAQFSLSGIVGGDTKETELLQGVDIFIAELQRTDVSEEGGTYIFRGITPGVFHVQYSKIGFKTIVKTVLVKDTATVVHVQMESTGSKVEEISVASGNTQLPSGFPFPVKSFSLESQWGAGAVNIPDALAREAGIDAITEGNAFVKPVIRGMSRNRIQVQQFGTRIENQNWYDYSTSGINRNGSERVEVIKGPASLLYGADASGGVIIISEERLPRPGQIVGDVSGNYYSNSIGYNLQAGLKGLSESGLFYGFQIGSLSHTSYIEGAGGELRKNTEDLDFAVNSKFNGKNAKVFLEASKSWGISRLSYSYLFQQSGIIGFEDSIYNDPLRFNEIQRSRDIELPYVEMESNLISSENRFFLGHSQLQANLAYQSNTNNESEIFDASSRQKWAMKLNSITYDLRFATDPLKNFGYTIGSQGLFQNNKNSALASIAPNADISSLGLFVLLRYDVKKWNFLAGARIDTRKLKVNQYSTPSDAFDSRLKSFERNYEPVSGSAGFTYHLTEQTSIKLNGATGYAAPNYSELNAYWLSKDSAHFDLGNDSLHLEKNAALDFGFVWNGKSISFEASIYYNHIYDYIHLAYTGGNRFIESTGADSIVPVYYYAQSNANISGAELAFSIHPQSLKWILADLSYALSRGSFESGRDLPGIAADKATFSLQFQSKRMNYLYNPYMRFVFRNYADQQKVSELEQATAGYSLLDFQVGGKIKIGPRFLALSISANNVLNERYTSHLSLLHSSGIMNTGRNVVIRLNMPFGIMKKK